jgi:phospholipid/cholesterol/gamma-HCH transport system substrate-binding protein
MIRTALKFGAFVLVCLMFTGYLAFTIGNLDMRDPLNRQTYRVRATFEDVTGLLVNDNVKIAGVVVGKVTGVDTEDGLAVVTMQIDDEHDDIPKDSLATVRWRNLIGQRYVYFLPGDSPETLQDDDAIPLERTESVVDLGELFEKLGPIVSSIDPQQVNAFLDTITQALDGREEKVGQALDDLAVLTKALASRDEAVQRLNTNLDVVADTLNRRDAQIETMLQNLILLADTFGENTATLDAALTELASFGTELDALLDAESDEITRILGNVALVTDTVASRLPELDTFLAGMGDASAAIFRAGSRGEFLNQKILCFTVTTPEPGSCPPAGFPVTGLDAEGAAATPYVPPPATGSRGIDSLLRKVADG